MMNKVSSYSETVSAGMAVEFVDTSSVVQVQPKSTVEALLTAVESWFERQSYDDHAPWL
jgi:hypothetical protein